MANEERARPQGGDDAEAPVLLKNVALVGAYSRPHRIGLAAFRKVFDLVADRPQRVTALDPAQVSMVTDRVPYWLSCSLKPYHGQPDELYRQHMFLIKTAIDQNVQGFITLDALRFWNRLVDPDSTTKWAPSVREEAQRYIDLVTKNRESLGNQAREFLQKPPREEKRKNPVRPSQAGRRRFNPPSSHGSSPTWRR